MQLSSTNPIRIVIADDHRLFMDGLKSLLQQYNDLKVQDYAHNGADLIEKVRHEVPDVVLTGMRMEEVNGIEATVMIKKEFPSTEVIGVFKCEEDGYLLDMLKAGARGFLLRAASIEEVVHAIHSVHNRRAYYSEEASAKMVQLISDKHRPDTTGGGKAALSDKEKTILRMICQEFSNKQIADHLRTSCRSVESTRGRLMEKIGSKNMVGIALYALKHGFYTM